MILKQLRKIDSTKIFLVWDDAHEGPVTMRRLRDACPCAGCQGETILLHRYAAPERNPLEPEAYDLRDVEVVGNYAIKPSWGDGHDQGIYTWEHLRSLCECPECSIRSTEGSSRRTAGSSRGDGQ